MKISFGAAPWIGKSQGDRRIQIILKVAAVAGEEKEK